MPGYCDPPNRFSSTNQPKGPRTARGPYLTPFLKKCLNKSIDFEDPDTKKIIHGKVKHAIVWRLILNAAQGDNVAIREVFDRIDGKVAHEIKGDALKTQNQPIYKIVHFNDIGKTKVTPSSRVTGINTPVVDKDVPGAWWGDSEFFFIKVSKR